MAEKKVEDQNLSLEQIQEQLNRINEEQRKFARLLEEAKTKEKKKTLDAIVKSITDAGLTIHEVAEVMGVKLPQGKKGRKPPKEGAKLFKYRNPETGELHTGRGGHPDWLGGSDMEKRKTLKAKFAIPRADLPQYNPQLQPAKST